MKENKLIVLTGNPNVGKLYIFYTLTKSYRIKSKRLKKLVGVGKIKNKNEYLVLNLPEVYSLISMNEEEVLIRDIILFDNIYLNIIVINSCFLERNLNLALQMLEINKNVIILIDNIEEESEYVQIDKDTLSQLLDVPVIFFNNKEINELIELIENKKESSYILNYGEEIENILNKFIPLLGLDALYDVNKRFIALKLLEGDKTIVNNIYNRYGVDILSKEVNDFLRDINFEYIRKEISLIINKECENIANKVITYNKDITERTKKIDKFISSKKISVFLIFILISYLLFILSSFSYELLIKIFNYIELNFVIFLHLINIPNTIISLVINGILKTILLIISIILPFITIFYLLFCLLEECGFLHRIVFHLDFLLKSRDKIFNVLKNNFIPCRIPLLIITFSIFFSPPISLILLICVIIISCILSKILNFTILNKDPSYYILELPLYRKIKNFKFTLKTLIKRVLSIILRVIKITIPIGIIIWFLSNMAINNISILTIIDNFLDPFASIIGLDGVILLAFILSLGNNELILPIILMCYLGKSKSIDISSLINLKYIFISNGWTYITALNVCIFSLFHFPSITKLLTIKKEYGIKWMILSFTLPIIIGIAILFTIQILGKI